MMHLYVRNKGKKEAMKEERSEMGMKEANNPPLHYVFS